MYDDVKRPEHYADSQFETIEVIRDKLTAEEFRGYCKGNLIKYTLRCGKKDDELKELGKGNQYLNWLMAVIADPQAALRNVESGKPLGYVPPKAAPATPPADKPKPKPKPKPKAAPKTTLKYSIGDQVYFEIPNGDVHYGIVKSFDGDRWRAYVPARNEDFMLKEEWMEPSIDIDVGSPVYVLNEGDVAWSLGVVESITPCGTRFRVKVNDVSQVYPPERIILEVD